MNNGRVTRSRGLRLLAAGAAVLVVAVCVWVFAGDAYGAKREREAAHALEKTFGPRAALESKYASGETNAEARRVEELAKAVGYDLTPKPRGSRDANGGGEFSEKERAAIGDYVTAQLVRGDDSVSPPSPELAAILEKHRVPLTAFEEVLSSAPSPRWAFHPSASPENVPTPNLLGHMQMQRLLAADALAAAARGDSGAAGRVLEAAWRLTEGLAVRAETVSQLIAMASARLQAGVLRKVSASPEAWGPRLSAMGRRAPLVDALVLEHGDPRGFASRIRASVAGEEDGVANRFLDWLREPAARIWGAEYSESWGREIAKLRDAPAFEAPQEAPKNPRRPTEVILAIAIPNIRNSFDRADRLALDAELTGKILRMKEVRRTRGGWPQPSTEIAGSRFPGLSWNYAVDGGVMTIALARELPKPPSPFVLPTSFSSRTAAP